MAYKAHRMLTKEEFQKFVELWNTSDAKTIAETLNITKERVSNIAMQIRKAGYDLPKKRINSAFQTLMREALDEVNFPKKV